MFFKVATALAALLIAGPSFSFYDSNITRPPVPAHSKINNTIARTVDQRMTAQGIPLSDPRRGQTFKALSKEATALAKARGALLPVARRIPWAALLLDVALSVDPDAVWTLGEGTTSGEISLENNPQPGLKSAGVPPVGSGFPPLFPAVMPSGVTLQVYIGASYGSSVPCWGSTRAALVACLLTTVNSHRQMSAGPNATVSYIGQSGSGNNTVYRLHFNAYRNAVGALVSGYTVGFASGGSTGFWVENGTAPPGGCQSGASLGAVCVTSFIQNPPAVVLPLDYPEMMPAEHYLDRPLSPAELAKLVHRLWRNAADTVGYSGVPYPLSEPVTEAELQNIRVTNPQAWPTVNDAWASPSPVVSTPWIADIPIPWNTGTQVDPIHVPEPGVDVEVIPPAGGGTGGPVTVNVQVDAQVDLGPDPGIGTPELEAPSAAEIVAPAFGWFDFSNVEVGPGECPRPEFSAFQEQFTIERHCQIVADNYAAISAIFIAVWSIAAAMIVLRA